MLKKISPCYSWVLQQVDQCIVNVRGRWNIRIQVLRTLRDQSSYRILQLPKVKNGNCACAEFERSKEKPGKDCFRFNWKLQDLGNRCYSTIYR